MSTDDDRAAQSRESEEAAPPHEHDHEHKQEQDHEHVHEQEHEPESATTDARPPPDAEPGSPPVHTPPLPVRRRLPRRDADPVAPALLSTLSAEELAAEAPSVEMLRRVRRALRDLPDTD